MKTRIKRWLSRLNIKVSKLSNFKPEYIASFDDILELDYMPLDVGIVIDAETSKGRAMPIFDYGNSSIHPFVFAAKNYSNSEEDIYSVLKSYYSLVTPKTALDVFGIKRSNEREKENYPYWAVLMPWDFDTYEQWSYKVRTSVRKENQRMGEDLQIESGWAWIGPSDDRKAMIEAKRLYSVLTSIKANGYKRNDNHDGDIIATVLITEDGNWIWQSTAGQHRACCAAAIGMRKVPIRINKIVRRGDVKYWPNVQRGVYSVSEALQIFDCVFYNKFNHVACNWKRHIERDLKAKK